ncbi:MAG: iron ABC transporter permease [Candidatus Omnitrophota bacterium]|jgi:iron complex transport system permease protein|nr:iron ABC transporter permease [Candidatus Omnitrophota bacterium]
MKKRILFIGVILIASVAFGIWRGSVRIPLVELFFPENKEIIYIRVARIILSIFAGAGLATSGVALQAVLKNPLAEPYLLGTSSGAGLGTAIAITLGLGAIYLPFAAFLAALLSIVLVYNLAREGNKVPIRSLILSGVIVAITFSGIIVFLVSSSSNEALHSMMWWLLGSLQIYDIKLLSIVGTIVTFGCIAIFILSQDLNAIAIGEEEAVHLGVNIEKVKKILFLITSLVTGAIVSVSGMIGFVGLIIPHMMRLVVGPNHKLLIPASCLGGAAFLVLCDTFARSLIPPIEVPIGVITSCIGAPIFIILLKRKQKVK